MQETANFAVYNTQQPNKNNNYGLEPIVEHHFNERMKSTPNRLDKIYLRIPKDILDANVKYFDSVIGVEKSPYTYKNKDGEEKHLWSAFTYPEILAEHEKLQQFTRIPNTVSGTSPYANAEVFIFQNSFIYKNRGLVVDGQWHELTDPTSNSPKKTKAAYVGKQTHDSQIILTIHDFRNGQSSTYTSFDYQNEKENSGIRAIRMCQIRQAQHLAHISLIEKYAEAAEASQTFFQYFTEPLDPQRNTSPYLLKKYADVYGPMAVAKEISPDFPLSEKAKSPQHLSNDERLKTIYLPLFQIDNNNGEISTSIRSYLSIAEDGSTMFKEYGQKNGCFFPLIAIEEINHDLTQIAVGEEYSTCASFYRGTNVPTFMAHDAGNMMPVVKSLLKNLPNVKEVVLIIDNDYNPEEIKRAKEEDRKVVNPGLDCCLEIKSKLTESDWGGSVILTGSPAINNTKTDLNDFDIYYGTKKGTEPYDVNIGKSYIKSCFDQQRQEQTSSDDE